MSDQSSIDKLCLVIVFVDALTLASLPDDGEMDVEINVITRSKLKLPKLSVPLIIIKLVIKISTQVEN